MSKRTIRLGGLAVGLAVLATTLTGMSASAVPTQERTTTDLDAAACAALVGIEIPATEFELATTGATITAAAWVDETGGQCRVNGDIHPVDPTASDIKFQVNLPREWNHRAVQFGGGGLNGSLVNGLANHRFPVPGSATPLQQGFVTLGSDSGHQGGGGAFAQNAEELMNYGKWSIKKTQDVSLALMDRVYGAEPDYFYFTGFSTGGAEALDAASLYADDYDGVLSGTPAYNVEMMHLGWGLVYRDALTAENGAAWVNPAKQALLVNAVYAACDPVDGLVDGVISDTVGCLDVFDVQDLRCVDGGDTGNDCLSDAQITALTKLASDTDLGIDFSGNSVAARNPVFNGGRLGFNLGTTGPGGHHINQGITNSRFFITGDPSVDFFTFDHTQHVERIEELAQIMDVQVENFRNSHENDTKIVLYTGMTDDGISPYNTIQLYDRIVADQGQAQVDEFLKFYSIPGLAHGNGSFVPAMPAFEALMAWVEGGVEPGTLVATDANAATVGRERPVCEHPAWPVYLGGDASKATSFSCVTDSLPIITSSLSEGAIVRGTVDISMSVQDDDPQAFHAQLYTAAGKAVPSIKGYQWMPTTGELRIDGAKFGALADGAYYLLLSAKSESGLKSTLKVNITVDNTRPELTIAVSNGTVSLNAVDAQPLRRVAANLYNASNTTMLKAIGSTPASSAIGETSWEGSWAVPAGLAPGAYTVRASVTDVAGNTRTVTAPLVIPAP